MTRRSWVWRGAVVLALAIAASSAVRDARAELKLVEVRPTYGRLGSTRPTTKVLPGEDLSATFVVAGLGQGADGKAEITLASELVDEEGKIVAQVPAKAGRIQLALGGDSFVNYMHFSLPLDFVAGKYLMRGTLTDTRTGERVAAEQEFEVLPMDFGLVRLRLASDAEGTEPAGGNLTVNQDVFVVGRAIGFTRKGKRIHVVGHMQIRDASGRSTMPAPLAFVVDQEVDNDLAMLDVNWHLVVNRPGKFTVQIEVRDEITGKRSAYELPLVVAAPPAVERTRPAESGSRKTDP